MLILSIMLLFLLPSVVYAIDASEVDEALDDGNVTILYFRDDSSVCGIIMSMLSSIASSYPKVELLEIYASDNSDLVSRFDVEEVPAVLIFDELGALHEHITGARSQSFYDNTVQAALEAVENKKASADKFYQNATIFYDSGKYTNALQNFQMAEDLYVELDNVERTLLCRMYIQKCNNYLSGHDHLALADELFEEGDYDDAASEYNKASSYFDKVNDEELVEYCSQQIAICEALPTAENDFSRAQNLMDSGRYGTAKPILISLKETYVAIGHEDRLEQVTQLLSTCELYIQADALMASGSSTMSEGNYEKAIEDYSSARDIYTQLGDSDKASLCTQNITLAQQYITSPTPAPDEDESQPLELNYMYIGVAVVALLVILLSVLILRRSSRKGKRSGSAMSRLSEGLASGEPQQPIQQELVQEEVVGQQSDDAFLFYRDNLFETKNSLLSIYSQWVDELLHELDTAQSHQYFFYRGRFESLQAFFTRSFSSDEEYLDQMLLSDVRDRLHECQSKLNDLMDDV
jgi:tetratricopeptide (TPR) repeat protein